MNKKNNKILFGITAGVLLVTFIGSFAIAKNRRSKKTIKTSESKDKKNVLTIGEVGILNKSYRNLCHEDIDRIIKLIKNKDKYIREEKDFIEKNILRIDQERKEEEAREKPVKKIIRKDRNESLTEEEKKPAEKVDEDIVKEDMADEEVASGVREVTIVYRTKSGRKYHKEICPNLNTKIKTSLSEAKDGGLSPCMICKPGQ